MSLYNRYDTSILLGTAGIAALFTMIVESCNESVPDKRASTPNPIVITAKEPAVSMFFTSAAQCVNEETIGEITQKAQNQITETDENVYVEVVENEDGSCDYLFGAQPSAPDNSLE